MGKKDSAGRNKPVSGTGRQPTGNVNKSSGSKKSQTSHVKVPKGGGANKGTGSGKKGKP